MWHRGLAELAVCHGVYSQLHYACLAFTALSCTCTGPFRSGPTAGGLVAPSGLARFGKSCASSSDCRRRDACQRY